MSGVQHRVIFSKGQGTAAPSCQASLAQVRPLPAVATLACMW